MLPVYVDKFLSDKAVHNWVEKFPQGRSKVANDARPSAELAEITVKTTCTLQVSTHWQSDGTGVSMLVADMSRNKCFSQFRISHVLRFIYFCDQYTDSPS
jgi:hypothetical protein